MQWSPEELALKSLKDWWGDAGVTPDIPISIKKKPRPSTPEARIKKTPETAKKTQLTPRRIRKDHALEARNLASTAKTPEELKKAISTFKGCDLQATARSSVVYDGKPNADIMVICGAPDREDDKAGLPASGQIGRLLDNMFSAIGLSRKDNLYIASLLPWHMPGDRLPDEIEWSICKPFIERQIELVAPKIIVTIGKVPTQMLLDSSDTFSKMRGQTRPYTQEGLAQEIPCIPLQPFNYILARPAEKARSWQDLQTIEKIAQELSILKPR